MSETEKRDEMLAKYTENIRKLLKDLEKETDELKIKDKILQETQKPKLAQIKTKAKILLPAA